MVPRVRLIADRRGIALITVLLVTLVVAAMAITAAMVATNGKLIRSANEKTDLTNYAALAGLEEARSKINASPTTFPTDTGYLTLEHDASVTDASGTVIPGVTRSTYAGPIGVTGGQYGVNGAIISVAKDGPVTSVRRLDIPQETFAKFAYFTNIEGSIVFGAGDQLQGPVHSNDKITIGTGSPKVQFFGPVSTASTVSNSSNASFYKGLTQHSQVISMPTIAQLTSMKSFASAGGTYFNPSHASDGGADQATTRIEFVAIDLDGDGKTNGADEGFFRVYHSDTKPGFVSGDTSVISGKTGMRYAMNCGDSVDASHRPHWRMAISHAGYESWSTALSYTTASCFLGGDPRITDGWVASDSNGAWVKYTDTPDARLTALGRPDAKYLFPLSRNINPDFKGVIYVEGKVVVSGVVRGRVSVVAPGGIIIGDDLTQNTDPSTGVCDDIIGLITPGDIVIADNSINSPQKKGSSSSYTSYDPANTSDMFLQAVLLTLDVFTVSNYSSGTTTTRTCGTHTNGRGCIYLTGGIVQNQRGAVGLTDGHGYTKRYAYNSCAATNPPPYFPTTGVFDRGNYYDMDPATFDVATWFAANQH
jgi:hypothetical protein